VLIIRRSKLYYTASGIITPVGGRPVHRLREDWSSLNLCTGRYTGQVHILPKHPHITKPTHHKIHTYTRPHISTVLVHFQIRNIVKLCVKIYMVCTQVRGAKNTSKFEDLYMISSSQDVSISSSFTKFRNIPSFP